MQAVMSTRRFNRLPSEASFHGKLHRLGGRLLRCDKGWNFCCCASQFVGPAEFLDDGLDVSQVGVVVLHEQPRDRS